jgi:hypothetical protein
VVVSANVPFENRERWGSLVLGDVKVGHPPAPRL